MRWREREEGSGRVNSSGNAHAHWSVEVQTVRMRADMQAVNKTTQRNSIHIHFYRNHTAAHAYPLIVSQTCHNFQ